MIVVENHDYPWAVLGLYFPGGSLGDPPGREGLAYLTGQLLLRGAGARDRARFAMDTEVLGGTIDVSVGREHLMVECESLSRKLPALIELLGDALCRPTLDPSELDKLRRETIAELIERRDSDEELCSDVFEQVLLQPDPAARPVKGTAASLERVTIDDVKRCYRRCLTGAGLVVGAAGDVTRDSLQRLLAGSLDLPPGEAEAPPVIAPRDPGCVELILVDKPERTQSQISIGHAAIAAGHPDTIALRVANTIFGGTFTSRLSYEIREKRGWSYGAYSQISGRRSDGSFAYRFYPALEDTAPALELGLDLYARFVENGVSDDEIEFARSYLVNNFPFRLQTPHKRLDEALRVRLLDLSPDDTETWCDRIRAVTRAQVEEAIRRHLTHDDLSIVTVCTAGSLRRDLEAIGAVDRVAVHPWDRDWPHPR